jgi:hypothetical protein
MRRGGIIHRISKGEQMTSRIFLGSFYFLIITLIISACVQQTPPEVRNTEIHRLFQNSYGVQASLPDGFSIEVPAGALSPGYPEAELRVRKTANITRFNPGSYSYAGDLYEVNFAEGATLQKLITMKIPYDENKIPPDRREGELFPAYYDNGMWVRVHGDLDEQNNLIAVSFHHDGVWAVLADTNDSWTDADVKEWLAGLAGDPTALENAKKEVEVRQVDAENLLKQTEWQIVALSSLGGSGISPEGLRYDIKEIVVGAGTKAGKILVDLWGGKGARINIGGSEVIHYSNMVTLGSASYHAILVNLEAGDVLDYLLKCRYALKSLEEAEAIVWGLEHPWADTIHPMDRVYLRNYYNSLAVERTRIKPENWNVKWTAYSETALKRDYQAILSLVQSSHSSMNGDISEQGQNTTEPVQLQPLEVFESPGDCTLERVSIEGNLKQIDVDLISVQITKVYEGSLIVPGSLWAFVLLDEVPNLEAGTFIRVDGYLLGTYVYENISEDIRGITFDYGGCKGGFIIPLGSTSSSDQTPNLIEQSEQLEPYYPLDNCAASRLFSGMTISLTPGVDYVTLRSTPDIHTGDNKIGKLLPGNKAIILRGPDCSYGWIMWQIQTEEGMVGWVPETDGKEFWLMGK